MRERVARHTGDLFLLASPLERADAVRATAQLQLRIVASRCQQLTTNLGGPYDFCPLVAIEPPPAEAAPVALRPVGGDLPAVIEPSR